MQNNIRCFINFRILFFTFSSPFYAAVNALNGKTDLMNQMLCDGRISFKWESDSLSGIFYMNIYVDNIKVASLAQGFVSSS